MEAILKSVYYDPKHPASFSSADVLFDAVRKHKSISLKDVKDWLSKQITYTLHKPKRNKFKRNPIIVSNIDEQWQADLADLKEFSNQNGGYKYIITVIDCFSKFAFAFPIKNKTPAPIVAGFANLFTLRKPAKLQTDQGLEFDNAMFKSFLADHDVHYFTTRNTETKCAIVERFNRTLKSRMYKYFTANGKRKYTDVLQHLVNAYNKKVHRSIGMAPCDVKPEHTAAIFKRLYGASSERELIKRASKPELSVGDTVRIPYLPRVVDKSYFPNWTDEQFSIANATGDLRPQYRLKDYKGDEVEGRFYPEELQKIGEQGYRIERILARRTVNGVAQIKVKWIGFGNEHNSWINKSDEHSVS